jgi:hypothetical protein
MPRMQNMAKRKPQNTTNPICSPAYSLTDKPSLKDTQNINFASVLCHELPPNDEKMIVSSASNLYKSESLYNLIIPSFWQNGYPMFVGRRRHQVLFPHDTQKEWSGRQHDGQIRKFPIPGISFKSFNNSEIEWVIWCAAHGVVGNTDWTGSSKPCRVGS